jgi:hypothetical protein
VSRSLARDRDALARLVARLARGDDIPAEFERELAAAELAAIECGELLDDLALHERALRTRSRR